MTAANKSSGAAARIRFPLVVMPPNTASEASSLFNMRGSPEGNTGLFVMSTATRFPSADKYNWDQNSNFNVDKYSQLSVNNSGIQD
jgi:hypothetical protein